MAMEHYRQIHLNAYEMKEMNKEYVQKLGRKVKDKDVKY